MEYSCKLGAANKLKTACLVIRRIQRATAFRLGSSLDSAEQSGQGVLKRQDFAGDLGQTLMLYEPRDCAAVRILSRPGRKSSPHASSVLRCCRRLRCWTSAAADCLVLLPNKRDDDDTYRLVRGP